MFRPPAIPARMRAPITVLRDAPQSATESPQPQSQVSLRSRGPRGLAPGRARHEGANCGRAQAAAGVSDPGGRSLAGVGRADRRLLERLDLPNLCGFGTFGINNQIAEVIASWPGLARLDELLFSIAWMDDSALPILLIAGLLAD